MFDISEIKRVEAKLANQWANIDLSECKEHDLELITLIEKVG